MENNQAKKKITSADKNPAPTSDILPHERIVSFESPPIQSDSHPSEISCILNTEPVPFTHQLISEKALLCTRVPKVSQDGYGTTECFLYGNTAWTLFIKPGFGCAPKVPKQIFKPYQIRSDGSVGGLGMFAKRDIEFGECILVERPLMVAPLVVDLHGIECPKDIRDAAHIDPECAPRRLLEPMVRLMLDRMSLDNRKAYLDLDNAQSNSVHKLCSIWGTNSFHFPELDKLVSGDDSNVIYTMVFKEMSRVNHSCLPNCERTFNPKSFTVRLSASRNIAKGEEIFYSYIEPIIDYPIAADRQKQLKLIGFTCSCASCCPPAPAHSTKSSSQSGSSPTIPIPDSSDNIRMSIRDRYYKLVKSNHNDLMLDDINYAKKLFEDCRSLLTDDKTGMTANGFQATNEYYAIVHLIGILLCTLFRHKEYAEHSKARNDVQNFMIDIIPKSKYLYGTYTG